MSGESAVATKEGSTEQTYTVFGVYKE